ncbi:UNVERIFIED_CONTAM: hypothetical protein Sindi_2909600 [Sesamum indicum]
MNRKPGYGAQLRANLDPTKGVGRLRQQDGGHGKSKSAKECPRKWMALEARDLYPAVGARARPPMSRRGAAVAAKPWARARAERPSVRILVVVANIQMRTLKAEEGKVDPKGRGEARQTARSARAPKGNRVKIPEPGRGG